MRTPLWTLLALLALPSLSLAQYVPIVTGGPSVVDSVGNTARNLALGPDGTYYAIVRSGTDLVLYESSACNGVWTALAGTPTSEDGTGSIVVDPDCCTLHVLWNARNGGTYHVVYHQAFDTCTGTWIATPTQISPAGATADCYANDIEVTPMGRVVTVYTRRTNPSWSAWLRVGPTFVTDVQINTDVYGIQTDLQAHGETVHLAFRTNTGAYGTRYRAYDVEGSAFVGATDHQVEAGTSNTSCIAVDGNGGAYVMYTSADSTSVPGTGAIDVEYDPAPGAGWAGTNVWSISDPPLLRGNVTYRHFSLAAGSGDRVYAVYSLRNDDHRTLYYQAFAAGVPGATGVIFAGYPIDSFYTVAGFRATQSASGVVGIIGNRDAAFGGNREVAYFEFHPDTRPPGRATTTFGVPCEWAAGSAPRLDAWSVPTIGLPLNLEVRGAQPSQPAVLWIGVDCTPIDLSIIGMTDCFLHFVPRLELSGTVDAAGVARFSLAGAATGLVPRCGVLSFQAGLLAPGANALGVVTTNAISTVFN